MSHDTFVRVGCSPLGFVHVQVAGQPGCGGVFLPRVVSAAASELPANTIAVHTDPSLLFPCARSPHPLQQARSAWAVRVRPCSRVPHTPRVVLVALSPLPSRALLHPALVPRLSAILLSLVAVRHGQVVRCWATNACFALHNPDHPDHPDRPDPDDDDDEEGWGHVDHRTQFAVLDPGTLVPSALPSPVPSWVRPVPWRTCAWGDSVVAGWSLVRVLRGAFGKQAARLLVWARVRLGLQGRGGIGAGVVDFGVPKCVLAYGPSGTGKTDSVNAIAHLLRVPVVEINARTAFAHGTVTSNVQALLHTARVASPCLVVVDDLDLLCPVEGDKDSDALAVVLENSLRDLVERRDVSVFVVATAVHLDRVAPALAALFTPLLYSLPTPHQRGAVVSAFLSPDAAEHAIHHCHGYSGADMRAVCAMARARVATEGGNVVEAFEACARVCRPVALHDTEEGALSGLEVPRVRWEDIGGLQEVKERLQEAVTWPTTMRDAMQRLNVRPVVGVLLYGPPGTGKTLLAKAVATESKFNFVSVDVADVVRGEVGETEKQVARVFALARKHTPCVVFFDEIQAVFGHRHAGGGCSGAVSQLLLELDHCHKLAATEGAQDGRVVVVVASTNVPWALDPALLRAGRFDRVLYVPPPSVDDRRAILERLVVRGLGVDGSAKGEGQDDWLLGIAQRTEMFVGADLVNLCSVASERAWRRSQQRARHDQDHDQDHGQAIVLPCDVEEAVGQCPLHLTTEMLARYAAFSVLHAGDPK